MSASWCFCPKHVCNYYSIIDIAACSVTVSWQLWIPTLDILKQQYLFTFSFWRTSVASFFLGVSTGVTGAEGTEVGADISAAIWGPWPALRCCGARGLLHWSQYTLTYSRDFKKLNKKSFLILFPLLLNISGLISSDNNKQHQ